MSQTSAKTWIIRTWILGGFWGVFYTFSALFLADFAIFHHLDLTLKNLLLDRNNSQSHEHRDKVLQDIVLVNVDTNVVNSKSPDNQIFYANVLREMISAKGILVHIPNEFITDTNTSRNKNAIEKLFQGHSDKIVLVANPYFTFSKKEIIPPFYSQFFRARRTKFSTIDNLKTRGENSGFVDFLSPPFSENFNRLNPVISYISERNFSFFDRSQKILQSSVCILSEITNGASCQKQKRLAEHPALFKFWGDRHAFGRLSMADFCQLNAAGRQRRTSKDREQCRPDPQARERIRNKTLLIDIPGTGSPADNHATLLPSPYGDLSVVEMQANLLASMRMGLIYDTVQVVDQKNSFRIIWAGTFMLILLLSAVHIPDNKKARNLGLAVALVCVWGYGSLVYIALAQHHYILPIVLPIVTWLLTSNTVILFLAGWHYLDRSAQQKQRFVEQSTVLSQTRKLLSRIATDIHDKPLQDLKLVMDQLEELTFDGKVDPEVLRLTHPTRGSISLVEKLSYIGQDIRDHLNDMQTVAQKQHTISPELASGLAAGIRQWLEQLQADAELRLTVQTNLNTLKEPGLDANSWLIRGDLSRFFREAGDRTVDWIDAREDIFRFFKEAMTNVMKHAQPFNGDATQVVIMLNQVGRDCTLIVENDGSPLSTPSPKGTGTKTMETIAIGLPAGAWQQEFLPAGGVRVSLRWKMPTDSHQKPAEI